MRSDFAPLISDSLHGRDHPRHRHFHNSLTALTLVRGKISQIDHEFGLVADPIPPAGASTKKVAALASFVLPYKSLLRGSTEKKAASAVRCKFQPQSDDGSGLASLIFIDTSQHSSEPSPGLLHKTSVPHFSHM
jgi:hypothetical protein